MSTIFLYFEYIGLLLACVHFPYVYQVLKIVVKCSNIFLHEELNSNCDGDQGKDGPSAVAGRVPQVPPLPVVALLDGLGPLVHVRDGLGLALPIQLPADGLADLGVIRVEPVHLLVAQQGVIDQLGLKRNQANLRKKEL